MELPEEIFKELTAGAVFDRASPAATQRATPRARVEFDVPLLRLNEGKDARPINVKVVDISAQGVGIESQQPIHSGDPFAIRFKRADGSPLWIQCTTVRWSVLDKNRCAIGAKFVRIITPAAKAA
jgi:hypothetical protein